MAKRPRRLSVGQAPWDPINGFRIGAMSGGVIGAVVGLVTSFTNAWVVIVPALVGGVVGYLSEKRKQGSGGQ